MPSAEAELIESLENLNSQIGGHLGEMALEMGVMITGVYEDDSSEQDK